jgi:hypothetical protein
MDIEELKRELTKVRSITRSLRTPLPHRSLLPCIEPVRNVSMIGASSGELTPSTVGTGPLVVKKSADALHSPPP